MATNFTSVDKFKFWCQKVLPLVYDDSLSYYEVLCKIVYTLNRLIENMDKIPEYIAELISDERIKDILATLLDQLQEQIAQANEGTSKTATAPRKVGELVWLNGKLYRIIHDMIAGDQYFEGSNCVKITIEELIKNVYYPEEELLAIRGIISGSSVVSTGDIHVYNGETQAIEIIKADEEE